MNSLEDDLDRYMKNQTPEFRAAVEDLVETRRQIRLLFGARRDQGISLRLVAKRMCLSVSDVRAIEAGEVSPTVEQIWRYAQAVGYRFAVSVEPFFD